MGRRCHYSNQQIANGTQSLLVAVLLLTRLAWAANAPERLGPNPALEQMAAEVARFVEADRLSLEPPCQVLFVGSSSIVHWKQTLSKDMAPLPVINRGFGGSQIEYVNHWFSEVVAPYRPRAIVFYAGENDLNAGKSVAQVEEDFDEFMTLKTRALGATPVYFISIKPSKRRWDQFSLQREVNTAVHALTGKRRDLYYVDVVTPMLEDGKPKNIFMDDGLHMDAEGYAIWTGAVRAAMLPHTSDEARSCQLQNRHVNQP